MSTGAIIAVSVFSIFAVLAFIFAVATWWHLCDLDENYESFKRNLNYEEERLTEHKETFYKVFGRVNDLEENVLALSLRFNVQAIKNNPNAVEASYIK